MSQTLTIDNKLDGGLQDYSRNLMDAGQFYRHENNKPCTFSFMLQDIGDADFIVPTRGSYVTFEDNRFESRDEGVPDGVMFTGYVSDEPEPVFLGMNNGSEVWAYKIIATSEDYLPQIKQLPPKIYVNKTRGFIIRDIVQEMFLSADVMPLDTTGVRDGGIERLYQTDPLKKFADMLEEFAKADAYRYRVLDGKLFYEPEIELLPGASDPLVKLIIDAEDPRFTPGNLSLERIATVIVNDVTVLGDEEPTTLVQESYVSDGYQGEHELLFAPYGVIEKVLVEDDFTAPSFDTALWEEVDDPLALTGSGDGSYLQMFEGSFNVVGGAGTQEAPEVYLRSRKGIELTGIINFRDGEIYFAPGSSGTGLVGGLFSDEGMKFSTCFSGWYVIMDVNGNRIAPVMNGLGVGVTKSIVLDGNHHYVLRRRFEFDIPTGLPTTRRGPRETDVVFGEDDTQVNGCWVTFSIEEIDITDPQNITTNKSEIFTGRYESVPEFTLYSPVVSYDLHAIMNFVKVHRPQQVRVEVDGVTIPLGDFIDGGLATVNREGDKAKLQWYSLPVSTPPADIPITPSATAFAHWKLGDAGDYIADSGATGLYPMNASGPITLVTGAPTASVDQARQFPGATGPSPGLPFGPVVMGPISGNPFFVGGFPCPFSITGWVKTTVSDGPVFEYNNQNSGYVAVYVTNGRIASRIAAPENALLGSTVVNDGQWHHFAVTHDAVEGSAGTTKLYVDGVIDGEKNESANGPVGDYEWTIGYGNARWDSLGSGYYIQSWFQGALDEIALWNSALTATAVDGLFKSQQAPGSVTPTPAYNPQTGVTIPPQGAKVDITYYRAEQARARIKSTESIAAERAKFGDDGIRQHTLLPDDVFPVPRTSAECQYLAQAYLADRATHRYEGVYTFETGERDTTRLDVIPAPGDLIPCYLSLPNGEVIDTNLHCTSVEAEFIGEGAYSVTIGVGPRNRFDEAQRKLLLSRKSSLDNPEITDKETLIAEVLNSTGYSIPPDPKDILVSNVNPLTFTVNMNPMRTAETGGYGAGGGTEVNGDLPDGVIGYEIRRDDTGWGQANYVARVSAATFALNRGTRDKAYFIRPFNAAGNYSRNSALVRVISPLSNTLVVTGLDGDISEDTIRLFIPIDHNPDIGGWLVQKNNADGPVLYQGDGISHRSIVSGATILLESGRATLSLPISTGATTVRVLVYNLLGEFGPETIFTITRAAPTI